VSDDGRTLHIGSTLELEQEEVLIFFLKANLGVFAWKLSDMLGIPRETPNISSILSRVPSQSSRSCAVLTTTSARPFGRR
jgi:hypothetical protein